MTSLANRIFAILSPFSQRIRRMEKPKNTILLSSFPFLMMNLDSNPEEGFFGVYNTISQYADTIYNSNSMFVNRQKGALSSQTMHRNHKHKINAIKLLVRPSQVHGGETRIRTGMSCQVRHIQSWPSCHLMVRLPISPFLRFATVPLYGGLFSS